MCVGQLRRYRRLLTFAEEPRLFLPRWSETILEETRRTHRKELGWPEHLAISFQEKLREHFPEAMVSGYEWLIEECKNHEKDTPRIGMRRSLPRRGNRDFQPSRFSSGSTETMGYHRNASSRSALISLWLRAADRAVQIDANRRQKKERPERLPD
jgi:hypothetical protein